MITLWLGSHRDATLQLVRAGWIMRDIDPSPHGCVSYWTDASNRFLGRLDAGELVLRPLPEAC